jgi:hypothetical protein
LQRCTVESHREREDPAQTVPLRQERRDDFIRQGLVGLKLGKRRLDQYVAIFLQQPLGALDDLELEPLYVDLK